MDAMAEKVVYVLRQDAKSNSICRDNLSIRLYLQFYYINGTILNIKNNCCDFQIFLRMNGENESQC